MTDLITKELLKYARSTPSDIVVPNWYVGKWEMDVFKLSKAGYVTEYEVKVSVSDFRNDFKKQTDKQLAKMYEAAGHAFDSKRKHDCLEGRCNQFYFVVPAGLVDKSEVPDNCGLIYFENGKFSIVKLAKRTKEYKFDKWKELAYKMYYRQDNLRHKLHVEKRKNKSKH